MRLFVLLSLICLCSAAPAVNKSLEIETVTFENSVNSDVFDGQSGTDIDDDGNLLTSSTPITSIEKEPMNNDLVSNRAEDYSDENSTDATEPAQNTTVNSGHNVTVMPEQKSTVEAEQNGTIASDVNTTTRPSQNDVAEQGNTRDDDGSTIDGGDLQDDTDSDIDKDTNSASGWTLSVLVVPVLVFFC